LTHLLGRSATDVYLIVAPMMAIALSMPLLVGHALRTHTSGNRRKRKNAKRPEGRFARSTQPGGAGCNVYFMSPAAPAGLIWPAF